MKIEKKSNKLANCVFIFTSCFRLLAIDLFECCLDIRKLKHHFLKHNYFF